MSPCSRWSDGRGLIEADFPEIVDASPVQTLSPAPLAPVVYLVDLRDEASVRKSPRRATTGGLNDFHAAMPDNFPAKVSR